ncbi:MAG: hypothetical protein AB7E37_04715 [Candidatus Altimarinota bacterium]
MLYCNLQLHPFQTQAVHEKVNVLFLVVGFKVKLAGFDGQLGFIKLQVLLSFQP